VTVLSMTVRCNMTLLRCNMTLLSAKNSTIVVDSKAMFHMIHHFTYYESSFYILDLVAGRLLTNFFCTAPGENSQKIALYCFDIVYVIVIRLLRISACVCKVSAIVIAMHDFTTHDHTS